MKTLCITLFFFLMMGKASAQSFKSFVREGDGTKVTLKVEDRKFRMGEIIRLTLQIENGSDEAIFINDTTKLGSCLQGQFAERGYLYCDYGLYQRPEYVTGLLNIVKSKQQVTVFINIDTRDLTLENEYNIVRLTIGMAIFKYNRKLEHLTRLDELFFKGDEFDLLMRGATDFRLGIMELEINK